MNVCSLPFECETAFIRLSFDFKLVCFCSYPFHSHLNLKVRSDRILFFVLKKNISGVLPLTDSPPPPVLLQPSYMFFNE